MSRLQLSIAVGEDTTNHQIEKGRPIHWEGSMFVASFLFTFPSLISVSLCTTALSCTIVVSKKLSYLLRKKLATFSISLTAVGEENMSIHGVTC